MRPACFLACMALTLGLSVGPSSAQAPSEPIGYIKVLSGTAVVHRGDTVIPAAVAKPLQEHDRLETGRDGALGATFRDNTRIAIGPDSQVDLVNFAFEPADQKYGFLLRLVHGSMEYLSGLTAKLAPDAMSIQTPGATVAVRGTHLLLRADP